MGVSNKKNHTHGTTMTPFWEYVLRTPLILALMIYIVGILLIIVFKPETVWDKQRKRYKHFGTGREDTIYPLWAIAIMMGVLCYTFSTVLSWLYFRDVSDTAMNAVAGAQLKEYPEYPENSMNTPVATVDQAIAPSPQTYATAKETVVVTNDGIQRQETSVQQKGGGYRGHAQAHIPVPNSQVWLDAMG